MIAPTNRMTLRPSGKRLNPFFTEQTNTVYFGFRTLAPRLMSLRSLIGTLILAHVAMASNNGPWKLKTQKSGFTKSHLIAPEWHLISHVTGIWDWSIIEVRYDPNHTTWRLADYDHKYAKVCTLRDEWFTIDAVLQHDVEHKRIHVYVKGMNNRWIYYKEPGTNAILFINHLLTHSGKKDGKDGRATPVSGLERVCREINGDVSNNLLCPDCKSKCEKCNGTGRVPGTWWGTNECSACKGTGDGAQQPGVSSCGNDLCKNGLVPPFPSLVGRSVAVMGAGANITAGAVMPAPTYQQTSSATPATGSPAHATPGPRYTTPCGKCFYNIPAAYKFCPECGTSVPNVQTNLPHGWRVEHDPATNRNYYVSLSGASQWAAPASPANVQRRLATATPTPSEEALCRRRLMDMVRDMKRPKSHVVVLDALLEEINRLRRRSRD